jgi:hypothetical protein
LNNQNKGLKWNKAKYKPSANGKHLPQLGVFESSLDFAISTDTSSKVLQKLPGHCMTSPSWITIGNGPHGNKTPSKP